jgi:cytidylate kinase
VITKPTDPDPTHGTGIVVAVDGTSGSGKSSTCRGVASRLGLRYLDTGAMYRAMTWWMLEHGVDVHDAEAVAARCAEPVIDSGTDPSGPTIHVDGHDVGVAIRTEQVTGSVSPVSTVPAVRTRLVELQRAEIAAAAEGRGIGSVVAPDAPVTLYLPADPAARAARRAAEEGGSDVAAVEKSLRGRDEIDSGRAVSPLTMVEGAVHLDTTAYTLEEVVDLVVGLVEAVETPA